MNINAKGNLQGVVISKQKLNGKIAGPLGVVGSVAVGGTVKVEPDYYEGEYEVTPSTEEQVLETNQKFLEDDVTVKKIPYAEVTNLANGITVTIGSEV